MSYWGIKVIEIQFMLTLSCKFDIGTFHQPTDWWALSWPWGFLLSPTPWGSPHMLPLSVEVASKASCPPPHHGERGGSNEVKDLGPVSAS